MSPLFLALASPGFAPRFDPCANGFHPTCEQARGFGMCGKMDGVAAFCEDTCAYEGNT